VHAHIDSDYTSKDSGTTAVDTVFGRVESALKSVRLSDRWVKDVLRPMRT
jgi:hypothetical protein